MAGKRSHWLLTKIYRYLTLPSHVFKDFVFKAKANDLQKKQGQGQGLGTKAEAKKYSRPTLRFFRVGAI